MPATSLIGKTRLRLQALAQGVSGGGLTLSAGRVMLGYDRTLESADFFANLLSGGPYLAIGTATLDYAAQSAYGPAQVRALLYTAFDRESDQDFTAVDDLLEALRDAWNAPDAYLTGEAAPIRIGWDAWRTEPKSDPGIVMVPLRIEFPDPPLPRKPRRRAGRARRASRQERKNKPLFRLRNYWIFLIHKSRFERIAEFSRDWLSGRPFRQT